MKLLYIDIVARIKQRPYLSVALVALVVTVIWFFFFRGGSSNFETIVVHPTTFAEQLSVSGTVIAAQNVDLGFAQSGRVSGVYAKVGDRVQVGALLAQTENGDLRSSVTQKQSALAVEEAKLDLLLSGTRQEELAVKEAQVHSDEVALAQARDAEINALQNAYTQSDDAVHNKADQFFNSPRLPSTALAFDTSDSQLKIRVGNERVALEPMFVLWQHDLVMLTAGSDLTSAEFAAQKNIASVVAFLADVNQALNLASYNAVYTQSVISSYITDIATGRANVNTARTTLTSGITTRQGGSATLEKDKSDLALSKAGSTGQDIAAQRARVASAEADVESVRSQLGKTIITAPFSGTVTRMDAKVGAIVSPGDVDISMISNGLFEIEAFVPEVEITGLAVGNSATTTLDAYGTSVTFPAKVVAIDPAETIKDGVSTYKTTLEFLSPDARIRSGMTASVVITTSTSPNALVVPRGAVYLKNGVETVQIMREGSVLDQQVHIRGGSGLGNIEVLSGLQDGDTVVLNPTH